MSQTINVHSNLPEPGNSADFDRLVLAHLDTAYNLARWLVRDEYDAEDIVQEASLRAFRFFATFRGGDSRAWLLKIVRNTAFTWLKRNRPADRPAEFDENIHRAPDDAPTLEASLLREADSAMIRGALDELPAEFREVVVLRDLEELSYKEIADIAEIPIGTVMSRLSRARGRLARSITPDVWKIEGLDRREDCERIVAAARYGGRNKVSCIILGRGEDDKKVREWLTVAATVAGFIGFAVGRSDFWEPLVGWRAKKATREAAVNEIARRYREFVDIFQRARAE